MDRAPTTDELLAISARHAPIEWEDLKAAPYGVVLDQEPQYVEPATPGWEGRFTTLPDDVARELAEVAAEPLEAGRVGGDGRSFRYRLAVRRLRDYTNSVGWEQPTIHARMPANLAYLNPQDMQDEKIAAGERILIESDHGRIDARAEADPGLRRGVVSIPHGFGALPDDGEPYERRGTSTNLLISLDRDCQTLNAMPRMSGIPVNLQKGH